MVIRGSQEACCAMINAGNLRHRVVIQRPVIIQDQTNGAPITNWEDVATVWASIDPLSVRELIAAQKEDSKVSGRITIRYRSDINHTYRLYHAYKDAYYNIEGILSDKNSGLEYLTIPVSEGLKYQEPPDVLPDNLEIPVISGLPNVGATLTVSNGIWANNPDGYRYQWYINDLPVSGQTGVSWLVTADINDIITAGVVAFNDAGDSQESISNGVLIQ